MLEANQKIYFVLTDGTRYQLTRRELFLDFLTQRISIARIFYDLVHGDLGFS